MRLIRLFGLAGIGLVAACGTGTYGGGPSGGCTPTATKVCMANILFDPSTLTIMRGTTVTWQNADGVGHTTTSNPSNPAACPAWDNAVAVGATAPGVLFNPSSAVTCQYYCRIHATPTSGAMRATIAVQ